jgi:hypothetical protein
MIIPIGVDCGIAEFLKTTNLRSFSFPFDWAVTYNGVSKCIEEEFKDFIPNEDKKINNYDVFFNHDFEKHTCENDKVKYHRRIQRLQTILETSTEEIIFCRKGHAAHHHNEHAPMFSSIKSDIDDAEDLCTILKNKYPNLNYKIIVVLVCGKCFDSDKVYKSKIDNIDIYNISTPNVDNEMFAKCVNKIFNKS